MPRTQQWQLTIEDYQNLKNDGSDASATTLKRAENSAMATEKHFEPTEGT